MLKDKLAAKISPHSPLQTVNSMRNLLKNMDLLFKIFRLNSFNIQVPLFNLQEVCVIAEFSDQPCIRSFMGIKCMCINEIEN